MPLQWKPGRFGTLYANSAHSDDCGQHVYEVGTYIAGDAYLTRTTTAMTVSTHHRNVREAQDAAQVIEDALGPAPAATAADGLREAVRHALSR